MGIHANSFTTELVLPEDHEEEDYYFGSYPMVCARFVREFFGFQCDTIKFKVSRERFEGSLEIELTASPSGIWLYWAAVPMPASWSDSYSDGAEDMYTAMLTWVRTLFPTPIPPGETEAVYVKAWPVSGLYRGFEGADVKRYD